jgi:predicted aspartyl protease
MISKYSVIVLAFVTICGFTTAAAQSVEVPFEFVHNQIVVKVTIDGKGPFNAMIDTGTDPSAIDIGTARQVGIKFGSTGRNSSGGGTDINLNYPCKMSTLGVGSISAANVDAAAIDLTKVSERMGIHIDAVLGYSFLKKRIVQFDYPRLIVRFLDRSPVTSGIRNAVTIPFRYKDNVLIDRVLVNGRSVTANLDTGSSGTFQISPEATNELGLAEEAARGKPNVSVGYNGPHENHEGTIKNVTIGTISVDNPPVLFFAAGTGHDRVSWSINIGNGFMKNFVVTVDYVEKKVTFAPPQI